MICVPGEEQTCTDMQHYWMMEATKWMIFKVIHTQWRIIFIFIPDNQTRERLNEHPIDWMGDCGYLYVVRTDHSAIEQRRVEFRITSHLTHLTLSAVSAPPFISLMKMYIQPVNHDLSSPGG